MCSNPARVGNKWIHSPDSHFWLCFWYFSGWFPSGDVTPWNLPLFHADFSISVEMPRIECSKVLDCFPFQPAGKGKLCCVVPLPQAAFQLARLPVQSPPPLWNSLKKKKNWEMFNCSWRIGALCYELYTQSLITASELMPASHLSCYKQ